MSNYSAEQLYRLLPAIYQQYDAEQGYPLRDLIEIIAGQAQELERDILRLRESWFIETCETWVVPYIGDLIGVRGTNGWTSPRAEVANTLGYRQAKGTAAVLEQLAHDVTRWPARVVEYFERLETTQYLNHVRPQNLRTPDLRRTNELELLNGPFETANHTADVRRIAIERGRYNIPNVGLHLWRLQACPLKRVMPCPAEKSPNPTRNFTFNVLGLDEPLFNFTKTETSAAHIAEEINVPAPIRRRAFDADLASYYPASLKIWDGDTIIDVKSVVACDLTGWIRRSSAGTRVAVDPVLGRLSFAGDQDVDKIRVTYHYGFSDDLGGGSYKREASFTRIEGEEHFLVGEGAQASYPTIEKALSAWTGEKSLVIEILDSRTYKDDNLLVPKIAKAVRLEIRAANGERPTLLLKKDLTVSGAEESAFELNGLLIADFPVRITGDIDRVHLQHTTLAPGRSDVALIVESGKAKVTIERSILGAVRTDRETQVEIRDSIVDASDNTTKPPPAYAALDGKAPGGPLTISRCTLIGPVLTHELTLAENSIFMDSVTAERRQQGCVRFCHVPLGSRTPRRFQCQPEIPAGATPEEAKSLAAKMRPRFTSQHYGDPGYCQLTTNTAREIRRGAEDESEMGVFSSLRQPQREDALRIRLEEYLRVGLETGIFFET